MNGPDDTRLAFLAETFRLLGDPTRLRVLLTCLDGPVAVGEIARRTGASQPLVSHHLRLLRGARLVRGQRQARQVFYEADDAHVRDMLRDMLDHAGEHD
ncbi:MULTISPECIES: metalloregulator ArsR/SmtB family transcription factor [Luteimonas]|uniref:Transcriptional regulator n=1 Tax=Luteimonas chenhongjianii TaxID=2006110 RepID=A0A290XAW8_9GAMM|nr:MULTISPECIES: metalloregulator ArsR/SmtB family transcription factor [Luteimonas]ATD66128.1 transcriptional regulator [Luteimonas chenhongjianii]RPD84038.1 ArsR family transcriptional regulator [Luteimonas sp. 100069]